MSSMRNAVQRRNHKERAQPVEREKWGILEKHKDYSLRARDYNIKKARLKALRQKAADRNPDEFNYGMLSSKSKKGVKIADRGNPVLSHDAVKLLKSQDAGYLQLMLQKTRKARERLEGEFLLRDGGVEVLGKGDKKGGHVVFVDDEWEQKRYDPEVGVGGLRIDPTEGYKSGGALEANEDDEKVDTHEKGRSKSRKAMEKEEQARKEERIIRKKHKKAQEARKSKLDALKVREKDLRDVENELEVQRAKMNNCLGGVNKNGVKWKVRERKR